MHRAWKWSIATAATISAAGIVWTIGQALPAISEGWIQTMAGLSAALVAAPLGAWAAGSSKVGDNTESVVVALEATGTAKSITTCSGW